MANHLENGTYLLDETERQTYTVAARMLDRVDRRLDLGQPLADFLPPAHVCPLDTHGRGGRRRNACAYRQ
jgi:hypothetical protein